MLKPIYVAVYVQFSLNIVHNRFMIDSRLQLLRAVAEHGTVTGAAEAMYRSPSGVSRQLRELGNELGVSLFVRVGRRIELTETGRTLVSHAHVLAEQAERATAALQETTGEVSGHVVVAGHISAVGSLIAPTVRRLRSLHPRLSVTAEERQPREALSGLLGATADLVVMPLGADTPAVTDPRFSVLAVGVEPIDLLVPEDHWLAGSKGIGLAQAASEDWILGSRGHDSREETLTACHQAGFTPQPVHFAQDWTAVAALVGAGLGVALVPRSVSTQRYPATTRITLGGNNPPRRHIVACTRSGAETKSGLHAVLDQLRDLARMWNSA